MTSSNDNRTTEFVDEPDTIRNEFIDDGILTTDNHIVHCGDCAFYEAKQIENQPYGFCKVARRFAVGSVRPDDFCAWGERKDG